MDVCFIVRRSIKGSLYQMFLHRSAGPIFVIVEKQQSFRQLAVVKAFGRKHIAGNGLVVAFFQKGANVLAFVVATLLSKLFTECEVAYVLKIVLLKIGGGFVVVSINKKNYNDTKTNNQSIWMAADREKRVSGWLQTKK